MEEKMNQVTTTEKEKREQKIALECLQSVRILHIAELINDGEYADFKSRLTKRFSKYLSPLR